MALSRSSDAWSAQVSPSEFPYLGVTKKPRGKGNHKDDFGDRALSTAQGFECSCLGLRHVEHHGSGKKVKAIMLQVQT